MFKTLIKKINQSAEVKASSAVKYAAFFLYLIFVCVISFFHEPWFDEAQAWQIARCAPMHDLFFTIPHFEGHPPLWYLILAPFARLGAPYELSLSIINIVFISIAVWILIFKTKLPDILKLTLPFTYFVFYQYGAISRPYSIMMLAFMLCAILYKSKEEKPFRMVLALMLLCSTSAYGIVYAFLICVSWLYEIMNGKNFFAFVKEFVKSRTFYSLVLLTIFAFGTLLMILPSENSLVSATKSDADLSFYLNNFFYTFLLMPYDATIGSIVIDEINLVETSFISAAYIPYYLLSAAMYVLLFVFAKRHKKIPLFLPFILMPLFFGTVFLLSHHIGLFMLYLIFFICVCFDEDETTAEEETCSIQTVFIAFMYITAAVQIFWSVSSSILEINKSYYASRDIAEYIIENDIQDSYIIPSGIVYQYGYDLERSDFATTTLPYLDRNIYPTFPDGYAHNECKPEEYLSKRLEETLAYGSPDYIIDGPIFMPMSTKADKYPNTTSNYAQMVFGGARYIVAADFESGKIFKGHYSSGYTAIYKKDTDWKGTD